MGMRTVNDPWGGNDPLVDKLIGNAFPSVKAVADNLVSVNYVVSNMNAIVLAANNIDSLPAAIASQGSAAASALSAVGSATTATAQATIAISNATTATAEAAIASSAATTAQDAAANAAASALVAANAAPVQYVAGRRGSVVLTSADIGGLSALATAVPGTGIVINGGTASVNQVTSMNVLGSYNASTNVPAIATAGTGAGAGANNAYLVTTAGSVAIDSIGTVAVSDYIVNTGGTKWVRMALSGFYKSMATQDAGAVAITGGSATLDVLNAGTVSVDSGFKVNNAGHTASWQVIPGTDGSEVTVDQYGAIIRKWDTNGNLYMGGSILVENGLTLGSAGIFTAGFTLTGQGLSGSAVANIINLQTAVSPGLTGLLIVDGFGAAGMVLDSTGSFMVQPTLAPTVANIFSTQDIINADASNLATSQLVRSQADYFAQRPVFGYNQILMSGQSDAQGDQGIAISTVQPLDSVMVGGAVRSTSNTAWVPTGGTNAFNPLTAVNNITFRTGSMTNMGTVGVIVASPTSGTITQTGTTPMNSVFQVGDVISASGFTGGSITNNSGSGNGLTQGGNSIGQQWTVSSVGSSSLTYTNNSTIFNPVSGSQVGPQFQIIQLNANGESADVEATNLFRRLMLANQYLSADPTRILVDTNTGVPGQPVSQFRNTSTVAVEALAIRQSGTVDPVAVIKSGSTGLAVSSIIQGSTTYVAGTDYSVSGLNVTWLTAGPAAASQYTISYSYNSPGYFAQNTGVATAIKTLATSAGKTSGISAVVWVQGTNDAQGGSDSATTYASYQANLSGWMTDIVTGVATGVYGQSSPPLFLLTQIGSINSSDVGYPLTIAQAQFDLAVKTPPYSSVYMAGPDYFVPRYGIHRTGNGYRWWGAQLGKIIDRIFTRGERWLPLHMTGAVYRGNTILVNFHVPCPPIQIQPFYLFLTPVTFSDLGLKVLGPTGTVNTIISATIVGSSVVEVVTASPIVSGSTIRYGGSSTHSGGGNICDSDPAVADVNYTYSTTSGQLPAENITSLVGKPYPLNNWCCLGSVPLIAG